MKKNTHPFWIHYPVAFWVGSFLADLVYLLTRDDFWLRFSHVILQAGCITGSFAVLTGFIDFFRIPQNSPAEKSATLHLVFCVLGWIMFCLNMLVRIAGILTGTKVILGMSFSAVALALMAFGNLHGRRLVYRYGIGVREG